MLKKLSIKDPSFCWHLPIKLKNCFTCEIFDLINGVPCETNAKLKLNMTKRTWSSRKIS
jgi:hypothetical protein